MERDHLEESLDHCDKTLGQCELIVNNLEQQVSKCKEIKESLEKELALKNEENKDLKESQTSNRVIFSILGAIVGIFLHIPIHF